METPKLNAERAHWNDEHTIDLIRKIRNDLVKDFLDERHLQAYVSRQYNIRELSRVKVELIRKELKELLIMPVDIAHYSPLIEYIRETDSASLADKHELLFYQEVERVFKKYLF